MCLPAPAKPKLVARESAPGQSVWKKKVPTVSDDGVNPSSRTLLSYALWQIYENPRWDGLQLPGKPVYLLTDNEEVQVFAKKAGLKCRGTAALRSEFAVLVKEKADLNTWGDLERVFGPQEKPPNPTSAERNPTGSHTAAPKHDNELQLPQPTTEVPVISKALDAAAEEKTPDLVLDGDNNTDPQSPLYPTVEVEPISSYSEDQAANNMIRPWSEVVKPRSPGKPPADTSGDAQDPAREKDNSPGVVVEQIDPPKPLPASAPTLDVPAPIPTKSPWKKLPPMPEPATVLSTSRPPSRDPVYVDKIEKQNFIANWVNNVQPPTSNVQLKRRSHHRNQSTEVKSDTTKSLAANEEAPLQPSAIMKRPISHSTSSSKEQIGSLTPPLTPRLNGRSASSTAAQDLSPVRHLVVDAAAEDSDEEVIVFNPRAKRLSAGARGSAKENIPSRPRSSGRLVPPELPSPQPGPRTVVSPIPQADTQVAQYEEHGDQVNPHAVPAEGIQPEMTPKNPTPRGPPNHPNNRSIGRNGPQRAPHHGRPQRSRQPVVPVVIDPDDFGRRPLPPQGRPTVMSNTHRGGFQNGYGRGLSPRGSPHAAPTRQADPDVDFVLKSGSMRGSTRGRGKLWVP